MLNETGADCRCMLFFSISMKKRKWTLVETAKNWHLFRCRCVPKNVQKVAADPPQPPTHQCLIEKCWGRGNKSCLTSPNPSCTGESFSMCSNYKSETNDTWNFVFFLLPKNNLIHLNFELILSIVKTGKIPWQGDLFKIATIFLLSVQLCCTTIQNVCTLCFSFSDFFACHQVFSLA